jgi:hypothetical protein
MKIGDLVRIKASQHITGGDVAGVITSKKGRCWVNEEVEIFWVLIDGARQTYNSSQLVEVV